MSKRTKKTRTTELRRARRIRTTDELLHDIAFGGISTAALDFARSVTDWKIRHFGEDPDTNRLRVAICCALTQRSA
jgi:hypothetical protein